MIFVTVGTTMFPFNRLLQAVDEVMRKQAEKERLVVQSGTSKYKFRYPYTNIFPELSFDKMIYYFKKARVIITHGGPATIFLALKYGKNKPLVVPRSKKLGEHVDDHQIFFAKYLEKKSLIKTVFPQENLAERIEKYIQAPEKLLSEKRIPTARKLVDRLIEYTKRKVIFTP